MSYNNTYPTYNYNNQVLNNPQRLLNNNNQNARHTNNLLGMANLDLKISGNNNYKSSNNIHYGNDVIWRVPAFVESHINKTLTLPESIELDKLRFDLRERIDRRIYELVCQLDVIRYKLIFIQKKFRFLSLCIIYLASFLTLFEGIKNSEFIVEKLNNYRNFKMAMNLSPLVISTTIALIGTIIKFYKYEEKIEEISRTIESSLNTWTRFKTIRETISCCDTSIQLYSTSMEHYINDAFKHFLLCKTQIDKNLNKNDRIRYVKYINKSRGKDARIYEIKDFEWRTDNKEGAQE
tara:strand:- start:37600 stop:38478 length:879 start_codon:yes stop_codon:yes gene_type:complete